MLVVLSVCVQRWSGGWGEGDFQDVFNSILTSSRMTRPWIILRHQFSVWSKKKKKKRKTASKMCLFDLLLTQVPPFGKRLVCSRVNLPVWCEHTQSPSFFKTGNNWGHALTHRCRKNGAYQVQKKEHNKKQNRGWDCRQNSVQFGRWYRDWLKFKKEKKREQKQWK